MNEASADPILAVRGLTTVIDGEAGPMTVVDGMSFDLSAGETLCIVGESGCGKSMLALSVLRLFPNPPVRLESGSATFRGQDLLRLSDEDLREIRGDRLSMIFQEPMTALNPVMNIGKQIGEVLRRHRKMRSSQVKEKATELLAKVRIPDPERRLHDYPHQLSGGMRQRAMIAMALACDPEVLIADEPTTALDVTIQAQILHLIRELQRDTNAATILITHNLGVVAEMADRVLVMYAGNKVEEAPVDELFDRPAHPYTSGLLASMPHPRNGDEAPDKLAEIPGAVPPLDAMPPGCRFAPRCAFATEKCSAQAPPLDEAGPGHVVACWEWHRVVREGDA
ncbi:MAG: ABC transporter ATP-binding protein [Pseudomonadota bacterium]